MSDWLLDTLLATSALAHRTSITSSSASLIRIVAPFDYMCRRFDYACKQS